MFRYIVQHIDYTTPTIMVLSLRATNPAQVCYFAPGQYAAISFFKHNRPTAVRCFSLASSPSDPEQIQFGIRIDGRYTRALSTLKPGEEVTLRGPFGSFIFDPNLQPEIVLCAGGIGITPLLSMLRYANEMQLSNKLTLVYSVKGVADIAFRDELNALAKRNENMHIYTAVSSGSTDTLSTFHARSGRLTTDLLQEATHFSPTGKTYFVCGPPAFMRATIDMLHQLGVDRDAIVSEAFSQGNGARTRQVHNWQFHVYGLGVAGMAAASVLVAATDILKTLPGQLLPQTIDSETMEALHGESAREADLDDIIRSLRQGDTNTTPSPLTNAARKEVTEAEAKIAEVNAQNAASASGVPYSPNQATSTTPTATQPTATTTSPAPTTTTTTTPKQPVCTTSASGVKTCV